MGWAPISGDMAKKKPKQMNIYPLFLRKDRYPLAAVFILFLLNGIPKNVNF
jgi:hypothetical protein